MKTLEFNWKLGSYSIHACPRRLVRFYDDEPNETIDFLKTEQDEKTGKNYSFSIAYFVQDKDGYWDLRLVGDRFWEFVEEDDWKEVMRALKMAHQTLNECCGGTDE